MFREIGENRKQSQKSIVRYLAQTLFDLDLSTTTLNVVLRKYYIVELLQNLQAPGTKQKTENDLKPQLLDI